MRMFKLIVVAFGLFLAAGCTIQSTTLLPDATAAGDPIAGFPADMPFKLESFDRQKGAFHYIATAAPEAVDATHIRYTLTMPGESKKMTLQARKLSDDNYLVRYADIGPSGEIDANDSALVLVSLDNGTYNVLTSIADKTLFEKAFPSLPRPVIDNDTINLESDAQAMQLSEFFRDHRAEFKQDQDYIRMRLMP